jgi:hypothetical protein
VNAKTSVLHAGSQALFDQGLGWIDVHLLGDARLARIGLRALDRRRDAAARRLRLVTTSR